MRILFLISVFLFCGSQVGNSCSCFTKSYGQDVRESKIIFIGTPVEKKVYLGDTSHFLTIEYAFKVDEILQGGEEQDGPEVVLYSSDFETGCGSRIITNQKHLVFAAQDSEGRYFSYCANHTAVFSSQKMIVLNYIRFLVLTRGFIDVWRLLLIFGVIGIVFGIKRRRMKKAGRE